MTGLVLHNYFRSSTSTRLRAALNLKGLSYRYVAHHLRKGENRSPEYLALNPQGLVPALDMGDGSVLTQSLAIIEYLEETVPEPPLLPTSPKDRARVRALAYAVSCEIHPVNNLRVLGQLRSQFGATEDQVTKWFQHWVDATFAPMEAILAGDPRTGEFCHGNTPGLADLCIFAQVINNQRFGVDMAPYPTIQKIYEACLAVPEIERASPQHQPDAE